MMMPEIGEVGEKACNFKLALDLYPSMHAEYHPIDRTAIFVEDIGRQYFIFVS